MRQTTLQNVLLATFILVWMTACGSFADTPQATAPPEPTNTPVSAANLAHPDPVRGQQVWLDKQCVNCHGETAQGGIGPTLAGLNMPFDQFLHIQRTAMPPKPAFNAAELPDQDAYNASVNGDVIKCHATTLGGGITSNKSQTVTIAGGYSTDWSSVVGKTTITGAITMLAGSLVFQNDILNQNNIASTATPPQAPAQETAAKAADEPMENGVSIPDHFYLDHNYPNPFNPITTIQFGLPVNSSVRLEVFNILGQRVATLVDRQMPAGHHVVQWDGTSDGGGSVSSGIYFYRIQSAEFFESKKMLMLK